MTRMDTYRALTPGEIAALEASGSTADDWSSIEVAEDFHPSQLRGARLGGRVRLASGVCIRNSGVRNYDIGAGTLVEEVVRLECRGESAFGNGTEVAVMNENGGRTVRIYSGLTAQIAYMAAVYRHRPALVAALDRMARRAADAARSAQGSIGRDCRITDCRLLRDVCIGHGATLEGVSVLSNGTVGDFSRIGIDVKAYDFVTAEHALVDNGSLIERCFIGERCIFDRGYTASDSLFFANSHCENGEAVSIFAGPYTVSHHKSSLLIAGMFSFFNAGSGTNQSNHLFKCGAVHQAVHRRGCKFASGAYVMSPAIEGVYTMIMGRHTHHHDTSVFPFSYLLEQEGRSALLPGANLNDGMDGMAAGNSAIIGLALGILAYVSSHITYASYLNIMYIPGSEELVIFICAFIGALIGFLWYNAYPAQVFMGDTGSLTIGGIIAVFAIIIHKELLIPILCGVFLVENLSVILQRFYYKAGKRKGVKQRLFKRTPIHDHFRTSMSLIEPGCTVKFTTPTKLFHESKITVRFWIVTIVLAAITIITLKIR